MTLNPKALARTATACPVRPVQKESVQVSEAPAPPADARPEAGTLHGAQPQLCCLQHFWQLDPICGGAGRTERPGLGAT